jgi:hypothetical protein
VTISERIETARRDQRVLARVCRAARRLEQAGRERTWALASARAEGISIRTLATAIGLSPSRVQQLVADADLDALDAAFGELRAAGWPAPARAAMTRKAPADGTRPGAQGPSLDRYRRLSGTSTCWRASKSSTHLPAPSTTDSSGFPARWTGSPVS